MNCEILTIGSEITQGHTVDTNASRIASALLDIGIVCNRVVSVPDDVAKIVTQVNQSLENATILVITGGLGSTEDDITRKAIAQALERKLIYDSKTATALKERFEKLGKDMPQAMLKQAYLIEGAEQIITNQGTAPGMRIELDKKIIFILPGVPKEMEDMLEAGVIPFLKQKSKSREIVRTKVIKVCCVKEAEIIKDVEEIASQYRGKVSFSFLPYLGEVHVKLLAKGADKKETERWIVAAQKETAQRLEKKVYGFDNDSLEGVVGELLTRNKLTLVIAESCTGGLVTNRITNISGSSGYLLGGVVTYSDQAKEKLLGVPQKVLKEHGAVSEATAIAMATGVRELLKADIGLGITGIAGPSGGTEQKPVGLVFIAISTAQKSYCSRFQFNGNRERNKFLTSQYALNMLRMMLLKKGGRE